MPTESSVKDKQRPSAFARLIVLGCVPNLVLCDPREEEMSMTPNALIEASRHKQHQPKLITKKSLMQQRVFQLTVTAFSLAGFITREKLICLK